MEYRVIWEIDIHAESPEKAAEEARALQLLPDLPVTIFDVWDYGARRMHRVDLARSSNCIEHAELRELRAKLRMLQCGAGLAGDIRDIASVMLIFLDREEGFFKT